MRMQDDEAGTAMSESGVGTGRLREALDAALERWAAAWLPHGLGWRRCVSLNRNSMN